jgi:hypothetical protein
MQKEIRWKKRKPTHETYFMGQVLKGFLDILWHPCMPTQSICCCISLCNLAPKTPYGFWTNLSNFGHTVT